MENTAGTDFRDKFLNYKGKPIVRCGNTIYYGDMADQYVAHIQIKSKKMINDVEVPDKVTVQIISTDETMNLKDRIVNKTEKNGLYEAVHIADIWLTRYLKK